MRHILRLMIAENDNSAPGWAARLTLMAVAGVCLLTASAKFQVPFYPVPMTLQTLVVLLLGLAGGGAAAVAAVGGYLALGAAGAPVFAGGGGMAYFAGPTGGFLLGFLAGAALAAVLAGAARRRIAPERVWSRFAAYFGAALAAVFVVFLLGWAWMALLFGDMGKALALGVAPFWFGDMAKALAAAAAVALAERYVRRDKESGGA